jgi:hypothetical protein
MRLRRSLVALAALLLCVALATPLASPLQAQDDDDDESEAAAAPAAPTGPPTTAGRDEAQAAVGQAGMIFELRSGARAFIPPGLPIGSSRRIRFAETRATFRPDHVASGFRRVGPVLQLDAAIDATRSPVVVSLRQPRDPSRPGQRLVLAMEQPTICREGLDPLPSAPSLCSAWELVEARFEGGRLEARLPTPGGYRLVFGTVPFAE